MSPDSPFFALVSSHAPKWLLMAAVLAWLWPRLRRAELPLQARRWAMRGLATFTAVTFLAPLAYGWLRARALADPATSDALAHALIGGALTVAEYAAIAMLGFAVVAGRDRSR